MLKLKVCSRCNVDLFLNQDGYIWSEHCLQCGYERELKNFAGNYSATGAMPKADAMAVEYGINKESSDGFSHNHSSGRFFDNQVRLRERREQSRCVT